MVKGGIEEFSLKNGRDIGDNNDDSRMQWLFAEEGKKIGTMVGARRRLRGRSCQLPQALGKNKANSGNPSSPFTCGATLKFLIDECLHTSLVQVGTLAARDFGLPASHGSDSEGSDRMRRLL